MFIYTISFMGGMIYGIVVFIDGAISSVPQCDADPSVTKNAVQEDKYENILTLIGYYDIETRTPIRLLMLQIFGVLCGLDKAIVSILLSSILPNELGRDIQDNLTGWGHGLSQCIQIHIHIHVH